MSNIVKINDTELQVIEYRSQRVATFAQVDAVHRRSEGTAGRNFREHKHRLVDGEDFIQIGADEFRRHLDPSHSKFASEDVTLLLESGYLMLVKSFTDDLAWQVQRQLVKGYFRGKTTSAAQTKQRSRTPLQQVKIINFVGDAIKDVPGIRLDVVAAAKLQAFEQHTGIDFTEFRRALPPVALQRMVHLNPTQIGERIQSQTGGAKVSAQLMNKTLLELGLQRQVERGYVLTEAGMQFGEMHQFTAQNDHAGLQIDWYEAVVEIVRPQVEAAMLARMSSTSKCGKPSSAQAAIHG